MEETCAGFVNTFVVVHGFSSGMLSVERNEAVITTVIVVRHSVHPAVRAMPGAD